MGEARSRGRRSHTHSFKNFHIAAICNSVLKALGRQCEGVLQAFSLRCEVVLNVLSLRFEGILKVFLKAF